MISLIQNELIKIFGKKSSWLYLIIVILGMVVTGIIYQRINSTTTSWEFVYHVVIDGSFLLMLFGVIVASISVSTEFSKGTIKQLLIRPYKRWKILLSKYMAMIIYNTILTAVYIGTIILMGLLLFDNGGFDKEVTILAMEGSKEVIIGTQFLLKTVYLLPGLLVIFTISFMLSTLFKNQSIAVRVGVFTLFFSSILGETITLIIDEFSWAKYLIFPHLDLSVFALQNKILDTITLSMSLGILAVYFLVFMVLAFWNFSKKDVFV